MTDDARSVSQAQVQLLAQPRVGSTNMRDFLLTNLHDPQVSDTQFVVAWAKRSGLNLIADGLRSLRDRGGKSSIICGLSQGGASVSGLQLALELFDEVHVAFDPTGRTVHTKLYSATSPETFRFAIGSQNLTRGGLVRNHEAALALRVPRTVPATGLEADIRDYISGLRAETHLVKRLTRELLVELQESGQIEFAPEIPPKSEPGGPVTRIFTASDTEFRSDGITAPPAATPGAPVSVDPDTAVVHRWFKPLPRSDAQRPNPGSAPTNTVTLTQGGFPIDKVTWFREQMFADADWHLVDGSTNHETAVVPFIISGLAPDFTSAQIVEHNLAHDSGQANRVTSIRWSSQVNTLLKNGVNQTGQIITLERFTDGVYRLTFSSEPIGEFV